MIPPPEYFSHLYEYVKWADHRQLEAARLPGDDEYFKERGWSFGSIHKILLHELSTQNTWLQRFEGQQPVWLFDEPRMAARSSIEPEWIAIHERFTQFLKGQSQQSLAASVSYKNLRNEPFSIPLWQLLVHVTNHATHHRGQLNSMIQLAGGKPQATDYQLYANTMNQKQRLPLGSA